MDNIGAALKDRHGRSSTGLELSGFARIMVTDNHTFMPRSGPLLRGEQSVPDDFVFNVGDRLRLNHRCGSVDLKTTDIKSPDLIRGTVVAQRGIDDKIWVEQSIEFHRNQVIAILG